VVGGVLTALRRHASRQARLRAAVSALLHRTLAAAWRSWRGCQDAAAAAARRAVELQRRVVARLQHQVDRSASAPLACAASAHLSDLPPTTSLSTALLAAKDVMPSCHKMLLAPQIDTA